MKVLFIGGTGVISTDTARLAVEKGFDVTLLNRGNSKLAPEGTKQLHSDVYDQAKLLSVIGSRCWDVILDTNSFTSDQLQYKLDVFRGRYKQWIFISSSAVYQRGGEQPVTERSPLGNFGWNYSVDKAVCESLLQREYYMHGSIYTIIRPSETYNDLRVPGVFVANPHNGGYTILNRVRNGKPTIVHDAGLTINNFTHATDIAKGIVGLFGNEDAYLQAYNAASDETHSWREVAEMVCRAAGVEPNIVYVPTRELVQALPQSSLGDTYGVLVWSKCFNMVYDSSKLKQLVPMFRCTVSLAEGLRRTVRFYDTHPEYCGIDEALDKQMDDICSRFK